jgi:methionine-rich copper-binding protein CopC
MMRFLILTGLACIMGTPAFAHAFLEHATPAVGSEVASAPKELDLSYTEPVEVLFCRVAVTDSHGASVSDGKPVGRNGNQMLVVPLKALPPGRYRVEWHVVSVDTHKTEGHFMFTVKP